MPRRTRRRIPNYFLYGESPRADDGRTVHVETIEARSARHLWKIEPHRHDSLHQLVLVQRGRGVALAEGSVAHFDARALSLVPAGAVHGFEFEPGTQGLVVSFADELLRDFVRREPALAVLFKSPFTLELVADAENASRVAHAARQLAREHGAMGSGRGLAMEGALAVLLAQVLRAWRSDEVLSHTPLGQQRQLAARFRELVEAGFRRNLSIPEYARELRVSESRLRNACLEAAGAPPIHLVHARMMLEAKRQLFYTSLPVAEIARELGFEDAAYFTRFFSRRAGLSPRSFRSRG